MGPDGIYTSVLRELLEVLTKLLCIMCQQSWVTGEVPVGWELTQEGVKGGSTEWAMVSQSLVPGKVTEQVILSVITYPAWICERQVLLYQPNLLL